MSRILLVIALACLAACGSDSPYFPTGYDVGTVDDSGGDTGGALCEEHADCRGGEICVEGICESIDTRVCEPGAGQCEGNTAVVCNAGGTGYHRSDCGSDSCVDGGSGASCLPSECNTGDIGCVDATTAYRCQDGAVTTVACADGGGCLAGECVTSVCEPNSRRCEGNNVIVCDAAGVSEASIACARTAECADTSCSCINGACVENDCTPGRRTCDGDDVVACRADGSGTEVVETCGDGDVCAGGSCVPDGCEAGDARCAGTTALNCLEGTFDETDCAAAASYCVVSGGAANCEPQVCVPDSLTCTAAGDGAIACNGDGSDSELRACAGDEYCSAGICQDRVCEPRARRCTGGDSYACTAIGSGFTLAERCELGCESGVCITEEPECTSSSDCEPPRDRCEGSVLVSYTGNGACTGAGVCDLSSVTRRTNCATSGRVCSPTERACVEVEAECTTDDECTSGFCVESQCVDCRSDSDCSAAGASCVLGTCEACSCPAGQICDVAGECIVGDPTTCSSDAECQDLAERLGASPDGVGCDAEVGCFVRGVCGGGLLGLGGDPFDAPCPGDMVCDFVFDLSGGGTEFSNACKGCDETDSNSCRDGESCVVPLFPFPDATPFCSAGGGDIFPFP